MNENMRYIYVWYLVNIIHSHKLNGEKIILGFRPTLYVLEVLSMTSFQYKILNN